MRGVHGVERIRKVLDFGGVHWYGLLCMGGALGGKHKQGAIPLVGFVFLFVWG